MRILVLRALKLGDFLTGVPAYRALRNAFPGAHITLAAPSAFAALGELLDGTFDEIVDSFDLAPLPVETHGADLAVDLHGRGPESHRILLATRPRRLIAFRHAAISESRDQPLHDPREHEVARWCRLLTQSGIPADPQALDMPVPREHVPPQARGATLLHPGAASEARCWPVERWIEVARAERRLGRNVVVTGGPAEIERAQTIAAAADLLPADVFAGRTNLRQIAALVAAAGRVVCGDTGVAHLATAYRRPSVLLFGPTPPSEWGPPPRPYHRVLWQGTAGDPHATTLDPGLASIRVEHVLTELAALA